MGLIIISTAFVRFSYVILVRNCSCNVFFDGQNKITKRRNESQGRPTPKQSKLEA